MYNGFIHFVQADGLVSLAMMLSNIFNSSDWLGAKKIMRDVKFHHLIMIY